MSGPPAWHHRPGEFCTVDGRKFLYDDGTVDEGPWPPELGPLERLPRLRYDDEGKPIDGHWICPGHHAGQGLGSGPGA